jgi:large subunit ribosomal protein L17
MRHRKRTIKLSRTSSHRDAMLKNLVSSLILHERVKTSKARAKAARSLADKVVHLAIKGKDTASRRRVFQLLGDKQAVKHLFNEVAGRFSKNEGGYTRIVPYGNALGDNSEMVFFMFSYDVSEKEEKKSTMRYHFKKKKGESAAKPKPKAEKPDAAQAKDAEEPDTGADAAEQTAQEEAAGEKAEESAADADQPEDTTDTEDSTADATGEETPDKGDT